MNNWKLHKDALFPLKSPPISGGKKSSTADYKDNGTSSKRTDQEQTNRLCKLKQREDYPRKDPITQCAEGIRRMDKFLGSGEVLPYRQQSSHD